MAETAASMVRIESLLLGAEPGLVEAVRQVRRPSYLGGLGQRWYADARPEARALLHAYLDGGVEIPGHHVLLKRVFKLAEKAGDTEVMGRLMHALDRLATWQLAARSRWDGKRMVKVQRWKVARQEIRRASPARGKGVQGAEALFRRGVTQQHLSLATRRYLQRRCWRFFRRLGAASPAACVGALCGALGLYRDAELDTPTRLLGCWGFVHALYGRSPLLEARRAGWRLRPGAALAGLQPALWTPRTAGAPEAGLWGPAQGLRLMEGRGRAVRLAGVGLVRAGLAGGGTDGRSETATDSAALARRVLERHRRSDDPEVLALVALAIGRIPAEDMARLTPAAWMELLQHPDPGVGEAALARMEEVEARGAGDGSAGGSAGGLEDGLLGELISGGHRRAARWALERLRARPAADAAAVRARLRLAEGAVIPAEVGAWLVELLRGLPAERSGLQPWEGARHLIDARQAAVRAAGLAWIAADPALRSEIRLYAAMTESPDADVQAFFLEHLEGVHGATDTALMEQIGGEPLRRLWAAVMLGVRQGGRTRLKALRQAVERLIAAPAERERLMPLVEWGLRSVSAPERREALARLVQAMHREPGLRAVPVRGLVIDWEPDREQA